MFDLNVGRVLGMSTPAAVKAKIIMEYVPTWEGCDRIAASMIRPLTMRVLYRALTPRLFWAKDEPLEGATVLEGVVPPATVSWAEGGHECAKQLENMQDGATASVVEALDALFVGWVREAPMADEWDAEAFRATLDALTDGDQRPYLVCSATGYAYFRKHSREWIDHEEAQSTTLRCGIAACVHGCTVVVHKGLSDFEVTVVSRRQDQESTPVQIGARVAEHDAEAKTMSIKTGVRFGFRGIPTIRRFKVPAE